MNNEVIGIWQISGHPTIINEETDEAQPLTTRRLLTSFSGTVEEAYENWRLLYQQLQNSSVNKQNQSLFIHDENVWLSPSEEESLEVRSETGIIGFVKWVYADLFIPLHAEIKHSVSLGFERFSFTDEAWDALISSFEDLRPDHGGPPMTLVFKNCSISAVQWDILTQSFNRFREDQILYHRHPIHALGLCHLDPFDDAEQKSFFKVLTSNKKLEKLLLVTTNPMAKENIELLFESVTNSFSHYGTLHFDLSQSEVTPLALGHLATWVATQGNMLERLVLNRVKFNREGLDLLGNTLSLIKPSSLDFSYSSLNDELLQDILIPLRDCRPVTLDLAGSEIKDPNTLLAIHQTHSDRVNLTESGLTLEIFESLADALERNRVPKAASSCIDFITYENNGSNPDEDIMPGFYELEPKDETTTYVIDRLLAMQFSKELIHRLSVCGVKLYRVKTRQKRNPSPLIPASLVQLQKKAYDLYSSFNKPTQDLLDQINEMLDEIRESAFQGLLSTKFDITLIPGDGNCLFASIGEALGKTHETVRSEIANYLLANHETYGWFISFEDTMEEDDLKNLSNEERSMGESLFEQWGSFDRVEVYLQKLRKDRAWGGECEINAILALYHHPLRIVDRSYISEVDEQGNFVLQEMLVREAPPHEGLVRREPIWLWRENGDHYNLLHPKLEGTAKRKHHEGECEDTGKSSKRRKLDDNASHYTCTTTTTASTSTYETAGGSNGG